MKSSRRSFLGQAVAGAAEATSAADSGNRSVSEASAPRTEAHGEVDYPRIFTGRHLAMIAFPLGGAGAGSVSLGGRGQLRDWEIFNRADRGNNLPYAFPSIWVQAGNSKPVVRVLEGRYQPPYEGQDGLGSQNAPGLSRLASARFTGEYPFARIDFEDEELPARVSLEAFSPFIPHEPDDSGLPVAVLRYRVMNPSVHATRVAIAWSIENPVMPSGTESPPKEELDKRRNEFRQGNGLSGLFMTNPGLPASDSFYGSFALALSQQGDGKLTYLRGWPSGRWWNSPLLFWDDFSANGELGPEAKRLNSVGALCLSRTIPAGGSATYEFLLAWHFPNRTPARCGWKAPTGEENTVIGNWYSVRFRDAWDAAEYAVAHLEKLERKTRLFAASLRESTLPAAVREAASANLSTLATTTCFRTADGEFHGFEGVDDKLGCCFGNCTHVWNYETTTAHLFPSFARSLRKAAFGFCLDEAGAMHFRQLLPDGKERSGFAAADGQMGQIVHAYLDWKLSGDRVWLENLWPRIKKAIEFAWVPGGWDANRDGVMEGVQHNTYDVEFYGPNPQCGIYYLAALRACEEMARTVGETDFASECRRLFENGSRWIDSNLFNGEFYVQQIRPYRKDQIAASLRSSMGADDPEHPEYQVGKGCLVDQLVGQYLADVCGLGSLLDEGHVRKALESIHKYNYKPTLYQHDSVQRTFALNNESALVICDYAAALRPRIPFPYFAEVMTGFEYSAATHMLYAGMTKPGLECIANIRRRYDGEKRNPWDEAECGHHYARAMAAWSGVLALSGFRYDGGESRVVILPKSSLPTFKCFWSTATAWGVFTRIQSKTQHQVRLQVHSGDLTFNSCELAVVPGPSRVIHGGSLLKHRLERSAKGSTFYFDDHLSLKEEDNVLFEVNAS
jgi:non-lysosomal glucosylceramidase